MKTIFENMFKALNSVIVLFGGEAIKFDFDMEKCKEYIAMRNPNAKVIPICAKTGEGIEEWAQWLREEVNKWKA